MKLSQYLGDIPIIFVIFNPDDYINKNNKKNILEVK